MTAHVIYITASDKEEATSLARTLVRERLAACANVFDGVTSVYRWEGRVQEDAEAVIIAKTMQRRLDRLIERVRTLHSYECPCVVSWQLTKGNSDYLDWIDAETA